MVLVEPGGERRVRLAGHEPGGAVVGVAVALLVHPHHVQQHIVAALCLQPAERHAQGGEHPPAHTPHVVNTQQQQGRTEEGVRRDKGQRMSSLPSLSSFTPLSSALLCPHSRLCNQGRARTGIVNALLSTAMNRRSGEAGEVRMGVG